MFFSTLNLFDQQSSSERSADEAEDEAMITELEQPQETEASEHSVRVFNDYRQNNHSNSLKGQRHLSCLRGGYFSLLPTYLTYLKGHSAMSLSH